MVLNLIITGIPSIRSFHTFSLRNYPVLNLIITGIPSIQYFLKLSKASSEEVLNLIITGIPSIQLWFTIIPRSISRF